MIARMEPENNIDMILDGFSESNSDNKCVVLGSTGNTYGRRMIEKYHEDERIVLYQ